MVLTPSWVSLHEEDENEEQSKGKVGRSRKMVRSGREPQGGGVSDGRERYLPSEDVVL